MRRVNDKLIFIILVLSVALVSSFSENFEDFVNSMTDDTFDFNMPETNTVSMYLPAVDDDGNGVLALLSVQRKPGNGKNLINIDKLVFWEDTQISIRTAKTVAQKITGVDANNIDLVYSITANNATVVGGPSAGAALTMATIAALEGKSINTSVIITGSVDEEGNIGPVGGIIEKAEAAKNAGAVLFIIPEGEATNSVVEPKETCVEKPNFTYCETIYEKVEVSLGEKVEIKIKEASNIVDVIDYFLIDMDGEV